MSGMRLTATLLVALVAAGCATRTDFIVAGPSPVPTAGDDAPGSDGDPGATPSVTPVIPTPVIPADVPGVAATTGVPGPGAELAVVGVDLDGSVDVQVLPGGRRRTLGVLEPHATVIAQGVGREVQGLWVLVDVGDGQGTTGWVRAEAVLEIGRPVDVTATIVDQAGALQDLSLRALGRQVASLRAARTATPRITLVLEDPGEPAGSIVVDVVRGGSGIIGERLTVTATVADTGVAVLDSVVSRPLCELGTGCA